jgi:hypothetical protein
MRFLLAYLIVGVAGVGPALGQQSADRTVPIYSVTVIQRALKAVNYQRRSGPTFVDLHGTVLLPKAQGQAKVEVRSGYTTIDADFKHIGPPAQFGTEYLTYVLWAITPDGRSVNLGEVIPDASNKGRMKVTCPASTFGLLVSAEPYFSVPYPSDVVVMENVIRPDTVGRVEDIQAKYELMPRGQYTMNIKPQELASAHMNTPAGVSMPEYEAVLELYQARNAVQIARADGADQYAGDTFSKAEQFLNQAELEYARKVDFNNATTLSREAVQAASDARAIALRRKTASR